MKFIKNLKISVKLLSSFFILLAAMITIGILSLSNMSAINEFSDEIYYNNMIGSVHILNIKANVNYISVYTNYVLDPELADSLDANLKAIDDTVAHNNSLSEQFEALIEDDLVGRENFNAFMDVFAQYRTMRNEMFDYVIAGDYETALHIYNTAFSPLVVTVQERVEAIIAHELDGAAEMIELSDIYFDRSRNTTVIIIVVMAVFAVAIGLLISITISGDIKAACIGSSTIASGDLTFMVPEGYLKQKDEVGDLARNVQALRDNLFETVSAIKESSDVLDHSVTDVNNTLGELNNRITDTSAATEELSAGMQETGASSEEMNATAAEIERAVESVAEKAGDGATKSGEFLERATQMGKDVNESIAKSNNIFNEIKAALQKALEDSKAVDEINALADAILGITSQTTLLALNASIEAARAGEAGRGFAVVANEISALADNSKNTVTQIQAITKVVMEAVKALASSSTNLLNFVSEDVMKDYQSMLKSAESYTNDSIFVSDMTSDLNATSEELLASIQVLMRSINEVAASAQEGARTTSVVAEQTSDIAANAQTIVGSMNETKETATQLSGIVARFKL